MRGILRAGFAAVLTAGLMPAPAAAQALRWQIVNEYPATSLPGEADAFFAETVRRLTEGRLVVEPLAEGKAGLRSREQLAAVRDGRFAMADSFGGALGDEDLAFLISSLPFLTASAADAQRLFEAARPTYDRLFAERGQKLVFVSPWPPSGVWSARALDGVSALRTLKIRTYDKTGTDVFAQVAESAEVVSFADLTPRLESGAVNAVLSSGDGGAGRQLWRHLRFFSDIVYAVPLSFGTVSLKAWSELDAPMQAAVLRAGEETTARQWAAMRDRVATNFARMRQNGVAIDETPPAAVLDALRTAAAASIDAWSARAAPETKAIVALRRTTPGQ